MFGRLEAALSMVSNGAGATAALSPAGLVRPPSKGLGQSLQDSSRLALETLHFGRCLLLVGISCCQQREAL